MKTIGLIGGTGWLSTIEYYRELNQEVNKRLGGLSAARCLLYSFDYADIDRLNKAEDHETIFNLLVDAGKKLQYAGADCLLLCANTLHMHADKLIKEISIPLIHIGDATGTEIKKHNISAIALLGTKWTMELDFYKNRLAAASIKSLTPDSEDRKFIHFAIMEELLKENFKPETKNRFLKIIGDLENKGAQGVVLGCTEIPLLIKQNDLKLPVFNTLQIHAKAAVDFALS
jgi:aspartate racemase